MYSNRSEGAIVLLQNGTESKEIKVILGPSIDALPTDDALMIMLHYYWDTPPFTAHDAEKNYPEVIKFRQANQPCLRLLIHKLQYVRQRI
jgi:hypothetical protein